MSDSDEHSTEELAEQSSVDSTTSFPCQEGTAHHLNDSEGDVCFIVEGQKIVASKAVLCIASPVFRAMLKSEFKEKEQHEIPLPEKKSNDFRIFLDCIYPDTFTPVTRDNVYRILPLAVEYQVDVLTSKCETILLEVAQTLEDTASQDGVKIYRHLQLAKTFSLGSLEKLCINLASELPQCLRDAVNEHYCVDVETREIILKKAVNRLAFAYQDETELAKYHSASVPHRQNKSQSGGLFGVSSSQPRTDVIHFYISILIDSVPQWNFVPISGNELRTGADNPHSRHLRALRLAYHHFPEDYDLKKKAVMKIREAMKDSDFYDKVGQEFDLLSEQIKHDIRGRKITQF